MDKKELTLKEYQIGAMSTCMKSSENFMYMLSGLTAEVGEINDKVAKGIRKEWIKIDNNNIVFQIEKGCPLDFIDELVKEISDVQWFVAGMSHVLNEPLNNVGHINLDKLASRKTRGVIDGNGDNR
jgi:NTP pyrophosphatase (non-canonical NTP hydrolase)